MWHIRDAADGLTERLAAAAREHPDKPAVVDDNRAVSYAELAELTERCRGWLTANGVGPGDVVAWQLPNSVETVAMFLACAQVGAVAVPIVMIYRCHEVEFICRQSGVRLLVVPAGPIRDDLAGLAAEVAAAVPGLRAATVEVGSAQPFGKAGGSGEPLGEPKNGLDVIVYTSGTESRPKGVRHNAESLIYDSMSMSQFLDLSADDVFFMPSPLAHITGLLNGIITPILLGATSVLMDRWNPARALELITRYGCTYSVMATPFLQQMFAQESSAESLRSFRFVRCGGADIPATLMATADRAGVTVLRVYGLSELPTLSCNHPSSTPEQRATTDGVVLPNVEVKILDDSGRALPTGQVGHIVARGPELFSGYVDADLNAGAFTEDGFFRTGDLGVLDAEGYLRIVGRAKDIIVRGGENLSALEIEEAIRAHPRVADVAVVGVPDDVMGQRACAFLVSRDGGPLSVEEVRAAVTGAGLALQKSPEHVRMVAELPRTPAGKVRKNVLVSSFDC